MTVSFSAYLDFPDLDDFRKRNPMAYYYSSELDKIQQKELIETGTIKTNFQAYDRNWRASHL